MMSWIFIQDKSFGNEITMVQDISDTSKNEL